MDEQKPKQAAHHVVRQLRVADGFLDGMQLDFADGLNCLIGGRGTGKTTALDALRITTLPNARATLPIFCSFE